jgi:hypothetical protein
MYSLTNVDALLSSSKSAKCAAAVVFHTGFVVGCTCDPGAIKKGPDLGQQRAGAVSPSSAQRITFRSRRERWMGLRAALCRTSAHYAIATTTNAPGTIWTGSVMHCWGWLHLHVAGGCCTGLPWKKTRRQHHWVDRLTVRRRGSRPPRLCKLPEIYKKVVPVGPTMRSPVRPPRSGWSNIWPVSTEDKSQ